MRCPHCQHALTRISAACPNCGASLDAGEPADLVPVLRTADGAQLALVKSVLEAAGIPFLVQGEGALGLFPLGSLATGLTRNLLAATLYVAVERADEARALLDGVIAADAPPSED